MSLPDVLAADGIQLKHDERYALTDEFLTIFSRVDVGLGELSKHARILDRVADAGQVIAGSSPAGCIPHNQQLMPKA